jgi:hypothetical protein
VGRNGMAEEMRRDCHDEVGEYSAVPLAACRQVCQSRRNANGTPGLGRVASPEFPALREVVNRRAHLERGLLDGRDRPVQRGR